MELTLQEVKDEGLDLIFELPHITTMTPNAFIKRIMDWCSEYLKENYCGYSDNLTEYQEKHFKKGVIYQMEYVIQNGDLSNDAGVRDTGIIDFTKIAMSPNALRVFRLGGLANIKRG